MYDAGTPTRAPFNALLLSIIEERTASSPKALIHNHYPLIGEYVASASGGKTVYYGSAFSGLQTWQLNVLHQAASCSSCYDIRDIAIYVHTYFTTHKVAKNSLTAHDRKIKLGCRCTKPDSLPEAVRQIYIISINCSVHHKTIRRISPKTSYQSCGSLISTLIIVNVSLNFAQPQLLRLTNIVFIPFRLLVRSRVSALLWQHSRRSTRCVHTFYCVVVRAGPCKVRENRLATERLADPDVRRIYQNLLASLPNALQSYWDGIATSLHSEKRGSCECGNHRGISSTPVITRLLASLVLRRLMVARETLTREQQPGFRPGFRIYHGCTAAKHVMLCMMMMR
ncbi:protein kinase [Clonorchis sinensis]|uniref:Protein kinase n=1 Tax=Clonorchis sinensis TaxID=79923 RepID=G7Y5I5_CLOSI|nr:protein kinase [Clonorchis sinensis]